MRLYLAGGFEPSFLLSVKDKIYKALHFKISAEIFAR